MGWGVPQQLAQTVVSCRWGCPVPSAASHREASRVVCPWPLPRQGLETLALLWKFVVQGGWHGDEAGCGMPMPSAGMSWCQGEAREEGSG